MRPATLPVGARVLYITYGGVLGADGDAPVVPLLERIGNEHGVTLLTFERAADLSDASRVAVVRSRLKARKIHWARLAYQTRFRRSATAFDVWRGIRRARRICAKGDVQIVHARGYIAGLIALAATRASRAQLLFEPADAWLDHQVDRGRIAAGSRLYRMAKALERRIFRRADALLLPSAAAEASLRRQRVRLAAHARIAVVAPSVDLARFVAGDKDPELVSTLNLGEGPVFGLTRWTCDGIMRPEMLRYAAQLTARFDRSRILIVTPEREEGLKREAEAGGIPGDRLTVATASAADLPKFVRLFDAGVCFVKSSPPAVLSTPSQVAEFLACGVPMIVNDVEGGLGAVVKEHGAGVVVPAVDAEGFATSMADVRAALADAGIHARCRATAEAHFDVNRGAATIAELYRQMVAASARRLRHPVESRSRRPRSDADGDEE